MAEKQKAKRRSNAELVAEVETKIEAENQRHEAVIAKLTARKEKLLSSGSAKADNKKILKAINGQYSPRELAEKLGMDVDDILNAEAAESASV